jgi:osmotically-inducible protein OsmY
MKASILATVAASIFAATVPTAHAAEPCTKAAAHVARHDDRRTTREVERRIANDDTVARLAPRVRVSTSEGVVTLRGTVTNVEDRLLLASLAESAPGVRRVEDRLEVREPWRKPRSASQAP